MFLSLLINQGFGFSFPNATKMRAIKIRLGLHGQMFPKCWHCHKWLKIVKHHCKLDTARMVEFFDVIETVRVSCSHKTKSTHFCPLSLLQKANTTLASPQFTFSDIKFSISLFGLRHDVLKRQDIIGILEIQSTEQIFLPQHSQQKKSDFLIFPDNKYFDCFLPSPSLGGG